MALWKSAAKLDSSSASSDRKTTALARSSSAGQMSGFYISDGSIFSIASLAPVTGQMKFT